MNGVEQDLEAWGRGEGIGMGEHGHLSEVLWTIKMRALDLCRKRQKGREGHRLWKHCRCATFFSRLVQRYSYMANNILFPQL